jgi:hypothetical protein
MSISFDTEECQLILSQCDKMVASSDEENIMASLS